MLGRENPLMASFSRVGDPSKWYGIDPSEDMKAMWSAPDFWLCEKALSPYRNIKIKGVTSKREMFMSYVIKHEDLGLITTEKNGKAVKVWRERITTNLGKKFTLDVDEIIIRGAPDSIGMRFGYLRRELERRRIDLQPFLDAKGL